MTNKQAKKMLKAKLECLKRETSGTDFDCNNSNCDECPLCYEQGNMGEQKEALDMAIKALEKEPCEDAVSRQAAIDALRNQMSDWNDDYNVPVRKSIENLERLPAAQPEITRCKGCKHQVKEWRTDKRLKDKGYMVCGCEVVGDACGYWALLGQDDDYCSFAERRTKDDSN